ncbi:MAG: hypothetical protein KF822_09380 [Steroidobacteraceae bacterium]|nr:hypothetical protein [Steroidobacteraceae bacterium]
MSTPTRYQHPATFVDRLFGRLTAIYGAQKMTAMWAGIAPADAPYEVRAKAEHEVKVTWIEALSDFHLDVVAAALRDLAKSDLLWPPSLPEFVRMCRDEEQRLKAEGRILALPAPSDLADPNSPAVAEFRAELRRFLAKRSSAGEGA